MKTEQKKSVEAQGASTQERERTVAFTKSQLEDMTEKRKSIIIRLMDQSEKGTTGNTIYAMAKILEKQEEVQL